MLCRPAAAACSLRLAAGTEGAAADTLQSLVLSSDTSPPPTTAAHNCPPPTTLLSSSPPPAWLNLLPAKPWELEVDIDSLLFQREREGAVSKLRHVLGGWGGNGTLPCLFGQSYSLFIQTRTPDSSHSR